MMDASDCCTNDFSVEVNLVGRELNPARVTAILNLEPTKAAVAGAPRESNPAATYELGFWAHEMSSRNEITECRDHQLTCLADSIAPHLAALKDAGMERIYFYYTMSSFIGMLNIKLNANTLQKLSGLGADLYISCFDCYDSKHPFWKLESSPSASGTQAE